LSGKFLQGIGPPVISPVALFLVLSYSLIFNAWGMNLNSEYQVADAEAQQHYRCIANFAAANSQEGHGNDVKKCSFVVGK
jgi:hypothetical protein